MELDYYRQTPNVRVNNIQFAHFTLRILEKAKILLKS